MNSIAVMNIECPQCRNTVASNARFCNACGYSLQARVPVKLPSGCSTCGGSGSRLTASSAYCPQCRWLRQMAPDYVMDVNAFMWELDAQAMSVLQALGPVTAAARAIAGKVGRPWFESATNGIRLSERQFPEIFSVAIRAAQIMGLQRMPEIYLSGEQLWDAMTLGSDDQAFIVIGSVLTYFKGDELLYLLAREMGHVRAGHVMWKTVSKFLTGSTHMNRSVMGSGLIDLLSPGKMVENAIDAPLMAWARQSEITADRAGMLAIGSEEAARKVLMSWSLKSFPLYQRINMDAWMEQEAASDERVMRLAETTLSTMPYLARRMKMLREFGASEHRRAWREYITRCSPAITQTAATLPPTPTAAVNAMVNTATAKTATSVASQFPRDDALRFKCSRCETPIKLARNAMLNRGVVRVQCPAPECKASMNVRPPKQDAPALLRLKCPKCDAAVGVPSAAMAGKTAIKVRCPTVTCRSILDVTRRG